MSLRSLSRALFASFVKHAVSLFMSVISKHVLNASFAFLVARLVLSSADTLNSLSILIPKQQKEDEASQTRQVLK